jgi:hypothetical protein
MSAHFLVLKAGKKKKIDAMLGSEANAVSKDKLVDYVNEIELTLININEFKTLLRLNDE